MSGGLSIGLDVGSTTVKAVVMDSKSNVLWRDYKRHETRQVEKTAGILTDIERHFDSNPSHFDLSLTGSGGSVLTAKIGGIFVQEVNAVSLTVQALYPSVRSVVELGGQDAKIIIFRQDPCTGRVDRLPAMNDKCAGGTGAVIDKIAAKLGFDSDALAELGYDGLELHPVAGKCGVFAETDINGLQKRGVPAEQLMASLFEAIVLQNLTVLTRGNTLLPDVLLLGGPNRFIPGLAQAWRAHVRRLWSERNVSQARDISHEDVVHVPDDAHYFAAIGAVLHARLDNAPRAKYLGTTRLGFDFGVVVGSTNAGAGKSRVPIRQLAVFLDRYAPASFRQQRYGLGTRASGFIGIDCGSSSTKAVFLQPNGRVAAKAYRLSQGNPLDDTRSVLAALRNQIQGNGASVEVLGIATTGYAKDVLKNALNADTALVETVAHAQAAVHFYPSTDVICDVGGQDIKLLMLADGGRIRDFRLNTQCSAGSGYFLQNAARSFGIDVTDYATEAFKARRFPEFGYGCSVFLQSDIVNFQRQGWSRSEILAGLAVVLPKNIWLHVAGTANLSALGRHFLLQGGTQKNLAAVRAQVEFIERKFAQNGKQVKITVHQHCGEAGAIGAALEALRQYRQGYRTQFIGFNAVEEISYRSYHDDRTTCNFCTRKCRRTFVDVRIEVLTPDAQPDWSKSKIPLPAKSQRIVVGNSCDNGLTDNVDTMRQSKRAADSNAARTANLCDFAARRVWRTQATPQPGQRKVRALSPIRRMLQAGSRARPEVRIGIPRVLSMYTLAPFFSSYFTSLNVPRGNLIYSEFTSEAMFRKGARRGAIDPCYPAKVCLAHVSSLLARKRPPDLIFFPMVDTLEAGLRGTTGSCACPTVTATPDVVKAALTGETDILARMGVRYVNPILNFDEPALLSRQMYEAFKESLSLSKSRNRRAVAQGCAALRSFQAELRRKGADTLTRLVEGRQLGVVLLGRPYHNDPGLNHGIPERIQALGYPVLTPESLPVDDESLRALFADDLAAGVVDDPLSISDVWTNSYSENTNRKIWAAKFIARHPNLVALEYSNFKCGHDAPVYTVIQRIVERSGTPYFCFKDMDENCPDGAIDIRLQTMDYFLHRYREETMQRLNKARKMNQVLSRYEEDLRGNRCDSLPA